MGSSRPAPLGIESPELNWHELETKRPGASKVRLIRSRLIKNAFTGPRALYLLGSFLLSSIHGLFIPLTSFILGDIFDSLSKFGAGNIAGDMFMREIRVSIARMGVLAAVMLLAAFFQSCVCYLLADNHAEHARSRLFSSSLSMNMAWFDLLQSGAAASASNDLRHIKTVHDFLSGPFGFVVQGTAALLTSIGISLYISWDLTLVILAGVPLAVVPIIICYTKTQNIESQLEKCRKDAGGILRQCLKEILTTKLLNGQRTEKDRYEKAILVFDHKSKKQSLINASQTGLLRLIGLGMFLQGLWYGGELVRRGRLSPGKALSCFWACSTAIESLELLSSQLDPLQRGLSSLRLLYMRLAKMEGHEAERQSSSPFHFDGDIVLRKVNGANYFTLTFKVSFAYPLRPDEMVLDNVSLTFPEGQTTYIVGKSGSGKSTIGQLMAGLYKPVSGCITVGRTHLAIPSPDQIRQKVLYVSHDSCLFSGSIRSNILRGSDLPRGSYQLHIDLVSQAAGLQGRLCRLQDGLETEVEGSSCLSGGQRQLVSIARALIRDAQILILDEAMSAVDSALRPSVWQNIARLRQGKTTVIITHHTEQISPEDLVYELRDGTVSQFGPWATLKKQVILDPFSDPEMAGDDQWEVESFSSFELAPLKLLGDANYLAPGGYNDTDTFIPQQSFTRMLHRIIKEMKPLQLISYVFGFISAIIHAACIPLFSFAFARLLSIISLSSSNSTEISHWILIGLAIATGDAASSFFMISLLDSSAQKWLSFTYATTFAVLVDQPLAWLEQHSDFVSEITECLDRESNQLRNLIGRYTGYKISGVVMVVASLIWSLALCWELTLFFMGIIPVLFGFISAFESISEKWETRANLQADAVAAIFAEVFAKIKTIKSLRLEQDFRIQLGSEQLRLRSVNLKRRIFTSALFAAASSMMVLLAALAFYFSAWLALTGRTRVPDVVSALTVLLFGISNFNITISMIPQASGGMDTYFRMQRVASLKGNGETQQTQQTQSRELSESPTLVCEKVKFAYPNRPDETVHNNLNITIPARKVTVLSGPSGSGKSTIFHFLTKIFEPISGTVYIDNYNLSNTNPFSLRSQILCVPQEAPVFDGTISANIIYPATAPSAASNSTVQFGIQRAAKIACIHDFIISLPNGYGTHISASSLSTGQRARLALARALYRKPKALLLDEVLSCLDWPTALAILNNLKACQEKAGWDGTNRPSDRMTVCIVSHDERVWRFGDCHISLKTQNGFHK